MQADVVGLLEQGFQWAQTHAQLLRPLTGDEGVVGEHLHAHGLGHTGDMGADLAEAHHAEGLFVELIAHIGLAVPATGGGAAVGRRDVPREGQHHRQGVLSRRDGVALR